MIVNALLKLGKYIWGIAFLGFAFGHLKAGGAWAGLIPDFLPGGAFWVYLTGVAHGLAGISVLIGKYDKLASFLLGLMLLIIAFSIHLPGWIDGVAGEMPNFLKSFAMAGAAWFYARYVAADPTGLGR